MKLSKSQINSVRYLEKSKGTKFAALKLMHYEFQELKPMDYKTFQEASRIRRYCKTLDLEIPEDIQLEFEAGIDDFVISNGSGHKKDTALHSAIREVLLAKEDVNTRTELNEWSEDIKKRLNELMTIEERVEASPSNRKAHKSLSLDGTFGAISRDGIRKKHERLKETLLKIFE